MKLAFVYLPQEVCPVFFTEKIYRQNSREGAILPPLGIAYLAAILEKNHTVKIIDANALRLSADEIVKQLKVFSPDLLLFSVVTTNFRTSLDWIKAIIEQIKVPVIAGGPQATVYPAETLACQDIDFCVIGEGWETLPELIDCLAHQGNCAQVKGIAFKRNNEVIFTAARQSQVSIDDVPLPARNLLPVERYSTILSKRFPVTAMMSSLGCPFQCTYCGTSHRVALRDPVKIVDEMQECRVKYKIKEILFYDEIFSLDKDRARMICDEIIKRGLDITWSIRTRADFVDKALIKLFAKAGCIRINYGIESADPRILKRARRDVSLSAIRDAVLSAKREKISVLGFFMLGLPGENQESILKTIALTKQLPFDYVQITKLVPLPQTQLYNELKERTGRDPWRDYVLGKADLESVVPPDSELTAQELDRWLKTAYQSFYFRPRHILHTLLKVKSFKELRGLVNSALALR